MILSRAKWLKVVKLPQNNPVFFWIVASVALQLFYLIENSWGRDFLSAYIRSDAHLYFHKAWFNAFHSYDGYLDHVIPFSPFITISTLFLKLLGPQLWVPYLVLSISNTLTVALLTKLTQRMYGGSAAFMAGGLAALSGIFIFYSGLLVKTPIVLALLAFSLYLFVAYSISNKIIHFLTALFVLVLAHFDRENILVIAIPFCILFFRKSSLRFSNRVGVFVLAPLIILGLSKWMASSTGGMSNSIGANFAVGNAPGADGSFTYIPEVKNDLIGHRLGIRELVAERLGREPTSLEYQSFSLAETYNYYSVYPFDFIWLKFKHLTALISQYSYGHPESYAVWRWNFFATSISIVDWSVIFALAVVYIFFSWRKQQGIEKCFVFSSLLYAGSVLAFFVVERYRLPLHILLIPLAGKCLSELVKDVKRLKIFVLLLVILLSHLSNLLLIQGGGWSENMQQQRNYETQRKNVNARLYSRMFVCAYECDDNQKRELAGLLRRVGFDIDASYFYNMPSSN